MPSVPGMDTSISTTSGLVASAIFTPSSPSPASPTHLHALALERAAQALAEHGVVIDEYDSGAISVVVLPESSMRISVPPMSSVRTLRSASSRLARSRMPISP